MKSFYKEHSKVLVSVDCIVLGFETKQLKLLIGKRQMDPGRGQWSLYGRFVGSDESLEDAANKDLLELTGLNKIYMRQVGAYGAINRDPGERVISVAYCALINVKDYDDRLLKQYGLEWVNLENLPQLYSDHNQMVKDTILMLRRHLNTEPLIFNLLPNLFTLTQLQTVYEAVLDEKIDKRNFRNRIKQFDFVEKTGLIDKLTSKRGAALYRFNKRIYLEDPTFKL
ncbi:MAG: DNA mismatch repair protein MutT [Prevotella sp.]|jgi:ADP-ribose pyrophosphatase YjhB (NUDIX family)|nr:DNA mismatch repair protein MutT [Prevotella sp.]MCH4213379.1 DNA mismatch repair protein MutT [Prevotella sp.]MCI1742332.1 DNA mismatch repair protein MutT [Prevotella sp.]